MSKIRQYINYFSKTELLLWSLSLFLITLSFLLFDSKSYLNLFSSLLGATALILSAKGNPLGQLLFVLFSLLYGYISFTFAYYGEMITYLAMTAPMALFSFLSWMKNPYNGNKTEVKINRVSRKEIWFILILSLIVTFIFYFILKYFRTANLIPSTISVATSFFAVCLTLKRSPYFALAYAVNDIVLIVLWLLATSVDTSYNSVLICFIVFLINDIYGFYNWQRMQKRQIQNI